MDFSSGALIIWLYGITGAVEVMAYTPQLMKLMRSTEKGDEISIGMWTLWFWTSVVAVVYGVFHLKDFLFSAFSGAHVLGCGLIILLTLYNRQFRFKGQEYRRRQEDSGHIVASVQLPHEMLDVAKVPSYMRKVDDYNIETDVEH